jgi:hypothetical protein
MQYSIQKHDGVSISSNDVDLTIDLRGDDRQTIAKKLAKNLKGSNSK